MYRPPSMLEALCDELKRRPCMSRDEMITFLSDELDVNPSLSSVTRALQSRRWSYKTTRLFSKQRN